MRFPFPSRLFGTPSEALDKLPSALGGPATPVPWLEKPSAETMAPANESSFLKTVGWVSAGIGALAIGVVLGREIRLRYKFTRRTPYDFYAHAGDEHDIEFGVGI